jgi:PelA/Pel-15E family pectate lyase
MIISSSRLIQLITIFSILITIDSLFAQNDNVDPIDISGFEDGTRHWKNGPGKGLTYERYTINDVIEIADNLLKFQNSDGGWPKNVDWLGKLDYDEVYRRLSNFEKKSTCDNRNTYTQIEYLSKVYFETSIEKYREGSLRGLEFILSSQNKNGGWRGADVDAITFNDEVMTGIMNLLLDIVEGRNYYDWINKDLMLRVEESLKKAVDVTLKCQIVVRGKKTGWCQQHDNNTLLPVKARSYELPSIVSLETTKVVEFLIRIEKPDSNIIHSINSAVVWLKESKIYGIRLERIKVNNSEIDDNYKRYDVKVIEDTSAPAIWARYYEIENNTPFFSNRDGVKVYSLEEVEQERRIGYAWYGNWPDDLLEYKYPKWLSRNSSDESSIYPRDTSYTIYSTYKKIVTEYPFIKIVTTEISTDIAFEKDIVYKTTDNHKLHLDLFKPKSDDDKIFPAVLLIHGGGWKSGNKTMLNPMAAKIAESGYVGITVEYRLSPEAKFPAAIYDIKEALMWVKQNAEKYNIDKSRIAILGCSAGGTLAAFVGAAHNLYNPGYDKSLKVQTIIDIDGILDFTDPAESGKDNDPDNPSAGKFWLGYSYKENPAMWVEASPLTYINQLTPPILFINSSIDRFHAGRDVAIKILKENNISYEVHTLPNTPHSFWLFEPWFDETIRLTKRFLSEVFK